MNSHKASGRVRVATVDDHPLARFALRTLIEQRSEWTLIHESASPSDAIRFLKKHGDGVDVLIIDLIFPDESGLDFLEYLHAFHPHVRVLVCSMRSERHYAQRCFRAGASGYLCKVESIQSVLTAVDRILDGEQYAGDELGDVLESINDNVKRPTAGVESLSNRELEVLHYIGQGMETRRIAQVMCRSGKTIDTYRYRIKKKMGITNGTDLIRVASMHATHPLPERS